MVKGGGWRTISFNEISDEEKYTFENHTPIKYKNFPWLVCKHCGLVYLRNRFSQWAVRMGCNNRYHPNHKKIRNERR